LIISDLHQTFNRISFTVWRTCAYKSRDGQFNPDTREVNDVGNFQDMSEAVFYNAMAWVVSNTTETKGVFEENAGSLRMSFLNPSMLTNPQCDLFAPGFWTKQLG